MHGREVQIQALDRTQPTLPMKPGRAGTMTHDYKRNGTTTLFAALDVLTGKVIGQCLPKHRNTEFLRFLRRIDREVPKGLAIHLILDNYGTHKHPNVVAWLTSTPASTCTSRRRRVPGSTSWSAGFATSPTRRSAAGYQVRPRPDRRDRGLPQANNDNPRPFEWTATAEDILEKIRRGRVTRANTKRENN